VYIRYQLVEWTTERLGAQWKEPAAQGAARSMAKLGLANTMSRAAALVAQVLGPRLAADTGEIDSFDWLPYVLETPAFHIGGGTDEVLRTMIAERALDLPREPSQKKAEGNKK
jgi:alkylation response protein AidB-like acyl-CoA dehydrogenase